MEPSKNVTARENITSKEYVVTNDSRNSMTVTTFENLTEFTELGKSYKVHNLRLTVFHNTRKLRSINLTEVKYIINIEINMQLLKGSTQVLEDTETRIMFDNTDDDSLLPQIKCNKCNNILLKTTQNVILCESCHSCQIVSSCASKLMVKLIKSNVPNNCE